MFAPGLGLRQAQPLFIGTLDSHTGIGQAAISFAFELARLMRGQACGRRRDGPFGTPIGDRYVTTRLAASPAAI